MLLSDFLFGFQTTFDPSDTDETLVSGVTNYKSSIFDDSLIHFLIVYVCHIPATPAQECVSSLYGDDYFGTVHQTKNGIPCQTWSELTPHSHSYNTKLKDQDDYCRNPTAPGDKFPWCYTIDPDIRWDFCDIPRC